jgi:hypothetical protein
MTSHSVTFLYPLGAAWQCPPVVDGIADGRVHRLVVEDDEVLLRAAPGEEVPND